MPATGWSRVDFSGLSCSGESVRFSQHSQHLNEIFVIFHVGDPELLRQEGVVCAEGQLAKILFLHLNEQFLILPAQAVKHAWMHRYTQLEICFIPPTSLENLREFTLNFRAHGDRAFHHSFT